MQDKQRRIPWVTASIVALTLALWSAPAAVRELCLYDRVAVLRGEVWRLWSGHLVHFSLSHLGWNLLVVGLAGAWIERAAFRARSWFAVAAPPAISLALLVFDPALRFYGGLSGAATATVAFACVSEWRRRPATGALWCAALAAVAMKIAWEYHSGKSAFSHFEGADVRNVPLSHLAGLFIGAAIGLVAGSGSASPRTRRREGIPALRTPVPPQRRLLDHETPPKPIRILQMLDPANSDELEAYP